MQRFYRIVGLVALVAILGAAAVGAVALAQEPEGEGASPFNFREKLQEAIAGALGISAEEYGAAVEKAQGQVLDEAVTEGWLTQEQAERMKERAEQGFGPGMGGGFFGRRGGMFGPGGMMGGSENSLIGVAAEKLGMTVTELLDALQDDKSIADLANEKGVDPQSIADAVLAQHAEWLAQAVEDGRLTQQQADWMQQHMEETVQERLEAPFSFGAGSGGCPGHGGGGFGPGMMGPGRFQGYPGQSES